MKPLNGDMEVQSTPGVSIVRRSFAQILSELSDKGTFIYLREDGIDCREYDFPENPIFIMGDDRDPTEEEEAVMAAYSPDKIKLGPLSLHANHCIVVVQNELDRREA